MSVKEIERFNDTLRNDPEMLKELKAVGTSVDKVVAFANEKGFDFSLEDLKAKQGEAQELSDDDLNEVAGGGGVIGAVVAQAVTVAGFAVVAG